MTRFEFAGTPTAIGSLPHTDPEEACSVTARFLPDIPAWPQLPRRSYLENMYVQFSEGFPGAVVKDDRIYVDRAGNLDEPLHQLYEAYLQRDIETFTIGRDYAAGLYAFLETGLTPLAAKGQVTGPVSWGLSVTDQDRRCVLYDETLADAAAKLLRLKAAWQEMRLREVSARTITFVDEPYMASFGSAYVPLTKEQVVRLLEEVFGGISGLKGIHCCANTDWSVVL
ncbi:MAG: methionine synthase, partial [Chloroflexota bacterium]